MYTRVGGREYYVGTYSNNLLSGCFNYNGYYTGNVIWSLQKGGEFMRKTILSILIAVLGGVSAFATAMSELDTDFDAK